jgi:hypothetical protein
MIAPGETVLVLALGVILGQLAGITRRDDRPPETREAARGTGVRSSRWWLPLRAAGAALCAGLGASDAVVLAAAMAVVALLDPVGEP